MIDAEEVRVLLKMCCEIAGSMAAWARENGISETQVQWTINGRREPSKKVLNALGLERVNMYRRKRAHHRNKGN